MSFYLTPNRMTRRAFADTFAQVVDPAAVVALDFNYSGPDVILGIGGREPDVALALIKSPEEAQVFATNRSDVLFFSIPLDDLLKFNLGWTEAEIRDYLGR